ncbi:hypothetical protein D3C86_1582220 [compost metagenome]
MRNAFLSRTYSMPMERTVPTTTPRKSTGAPGVSPRTDWSKLSTASAGASSSGSFMASAWSPASRYCVFSAAAVRAEELSGDWNATPPSSTVTSDCVESLSPPASSFRSTPLACQKRVSAVTSVSYGLLTNTRSVMSRPFGSS